MRLITLPIFLRCVWKVMNWPQESRRWRPDRSGLDWEPYHPIRNQRMYKSILMNAARNIQRRWRGLVSRRRILRADPTGWERRIIDTGKIGDLPKEILIEIWRRVFRDAATRIQRLFRAVSARDRVFESLWRQRGGLTLTHVQDRGVIQRFNRRDEQREFEKFMDIMPHLSWRRAREKWLWIMNRPRERI